MDFDCEVFTAGHVSVAARVFSQRGRVGVSVVGKVTFALVPDGTMQLLAPSPICVAELPRAEGVLTSARRASDVALFLQRPEVIAEAVAFAPSGQAETMAVRIAIQRGERALFSKELLIVGDRTGAKGESPQPLPFSSMPITYERAPGGIGQPENPVGVGEESGHRITLPNVLPAKGKPPAAASGAVQPPVGFGPVSSAWLHRRARRGKLARPLVDEALWVTLPDDFDGSYFQAAPSDQQIEDLAPDDELIFEGLHPQHARLRTRLPRMRVVAMVETSQRRRVPVGLRLDTLYFEPHELRAELTFRGVVEVMPEMVPGLKIVGAVEDLSRPLVFPADLAALGASVRSLRHRDEAERSPVSNNLGTVLMGPASSSGGGHKHAGTVMLGESPSSKTLPFDKSRRRSSPKVPVVRAPVIVPAHVAPASQNLSHTLEIAPAAPVVPVSPALAPVASPAAAAAAAPAPLPAAAPATPPEVAPPAPAPAAPPAPSALAVEPAPAPAAAPKPAVPRSASASVWAKPEAPAQPAPSTGPVSRPVVQPSADRSASLYKKFKPK